MGSEETYLSLHNPRFSNVTERITYRSSIIGARDSGDAGAVTLNKEVLLPRMCFT